MMFPLTLDLLAWRWSTGLEHQPGPRADTAAQSAVASSLPPRDLQQPQGDIPYEEPLSNPGRGISVVEVKNITCLKTHAVGLAKRRADLTLIQEHAANEYDAARFKAEFRSMHRRTLALSPPDRNSSKPSGGVGAIAHANDTLFVCAPITDSFKEACASGRAILIAFGKGKGSDLVYFYVLYGFVGGHAAPPKDAGTSKLVQAIADEADARPLGASFLVGDVNADLPDIAAMRHLLSDKHWTDIGGCADQ